MSTNHIKTISTQISVPIRTIDIGVLPHSLKQEGSLDPPPAPVLVLAAFAFLRSSLLPSSSRPPLCSKFDCSPAPTLRICPTEESSWAGFQINTVREDCAWDWDPSWRALLGTLTPKEVTLCSKGLTPCTCISTLHFPATHNNQSNRELDARHSSETEPSKNKANGIQGISVSK